MANIAYNEMQAFLRACEKNGVSVSTNPSHQNRIGSIAAGGFVPLVGKAGVQPYVTIPGMNVPLQRKHAHRNNRNSRVFLMEAEHVNRSKRSKKRRKKSFSLY